MRVAIIGGKLQGVEATYLAKKAGWDVLLIDKDPEAPAALMCDRFRVMTVTSGCDPKEILQEVDLIVPAAEDHEVMAVLKRWALETAIPLAIDMEAYALSSSKKASDQIFKALKINTPDPWPGCGFPVTVKPDGGSGSQGVRVLHNEKELAAQFPSRDSLDQMVVQAYLEGPLYSIEVMGGPGHYRPLQVTELHMDSMHDCKRVLAPTELDSALVHDFETMATTIAQRIRLKGLMDVEVILHEGQLRVLEIDARLPSQTPTAVYQSTGINMVEALGDLFLTGRMSLNPTDPMQATIYEHVKVVRGRIAVKGEHVMTGAGPLALRPGLFGAHEAITNYHPDRAEWVATFIHKGKNKEEVLGKQQQTYENIRGTGQG